MLFLPAFCLTKADFIAIRCSVQAFYPGGRLVIIIFTFVLPFIFKKWKRLSKAWFAAILLVGVVWLDRGLVSFRNKLWPTGFSHVLPWLSSPTSTPSCAGRHSGPAWMANYHKSRGLIKVWLSSECSRGYAERGISRGSTQDHTCLSEAGAVKLDCWPLSTFDPKVPRCRVNSAAGKGSHKKKENSAAGCCHWQELGDVIAAELIANEVYKGFYADSFFCWAL